MTQPPQPAAPEADWIGQTLDGRYKIERVLGAGGLGTVYLAKNLRLDRPVAVKMLHRELLPSPELRKRFDREVKTLSRLAHPHIVSLIDSGVLDDGVGYLVMELLEGQSLEDHLSPSGSLEPAQAVEVARQMLLGLAEAHDKGVLHRDLKPANVFLRTLAEGIHVKLLDFGLAKVRSDLATDPGAYPTLTADGTIVGTPTYMAPEQATGSGVTAAADLYAVGIVLFEMLAGRPPFRHENKLETIRAHMTQPVPELDVVAPHLRPTAELRAFVRRALEKDHKNRFADARAMLKELEALPRPVATLEGAAPARKKSTPAPGTEETIALKSAELAAAELLSMAGSSVSMVSLDSSAQAVPPARPTPPRPPRAAPSGGRRVALAVGAGIVFVVALGWAGSWFASSALTREPPPPAPIIATADEPSAAEAPSADEGGAENPFASGGLPDELRSARREILRGRVLSDAQIRDVEAYRRLHPTDPRAPLLLARSERFRNHWDTMVPLYVAAYAAGPSAAGFAPMLADLLRAAGQDSASDAASDAIVSIYGARATVAVEARLAELTPGPELTHVTALRERLTTP